MKSKQLGWVFFALAIVGMSVGAVHAGVVAHYGFENAANLGEDSSEAGNDATVVGSPVQSSGPFGNAIQLDGFAGLKPHLQLPDIESHFGAQEGTFAAWVKLNAYPPSHPSQTGWAYMGDSPSDSHYPYTDGKAYLDALRNQRVESIAISSDRGCWVCLSDAQLGTEWHHMAITSDASDWKLYQNGNLIRRVNPSWGFPAWPKVGQGTGGETFDGMMDEVWIGNVALNETQVNILYAENRFVPEPFSPADFDNDGDVDGDDFLVWQTGFPTASGATMGDGDADGDGDVDGDDFLAWQAGFGSGAGAVQASAVPAPAAFVLLALPSICLAGLRRKRRNGQ